MQNANMYNIHDFNEGEKYIGSKIKEWEASMKKIKLELTGFEILKTDLVFGAVTTHETKLQIVEEFSKFLKVRQYVAYANQEKLEVVGSLKSFPRYLLDNHDLDEILETLSSYNKENESEIRELAKTCLQRREEKAKAKALSEAQAKEIVEVESAKIVQVVHTGSGNGNGNGNGQKPQSFSSMNKTAIILPDQNKTVMLTDDEKQQMIQQERKNELIKMTERKELKDVHALLGGKIPEKNQGYAVSTRAAKNAKRQEAKNHIKSHGQVISGFDDVKNIWIFCPNLKITGRYGTDMYIHEAIKGDTATAEKLLSRFKDQKMLKDRSSLLHTSAELRRVFDIKDIEVPKEGIAFTPFNFYLPFSGDKNLGDVPKFTYVVESIVDLPDITEDRFYLKLINPEDMSKVVYLSGETFKNLRKISGKIATDILQNSTNLTYGEPPQYDAEGNVLSKEVYITSQQPIDILSIPERSGATPTIIPNLKISKLFNSLQVENGQKTTVLSIIYEQKTAQYPVQFSSMDTMNINLQNGLLAQMESMLVPKGNPLFFLEKNERETSISFHEVTGYFASIETQNAIFKGGNLEDYMSTIFVAFKNHEAKDSIAMNGLQRGTSLEKEYVKIMSLEEVFSKKTYKRVSEIQVEDRTIRLGSRILYNTGTVSAIYANIVNPEDARIEYKTVDAKKDEKGQYVEQEGIATIFLDELVRKEKTILEETTQVYNRKLEAEQKEQQALQDRKFVGNIYNTYFVPCYTPSVVGIKNSEYKSSIKSEMTQTHFFNNFGVVSLQNPKTTGMAHSVDTKLQVTDSKKENEPEKQQMSCDVHLKNKIAIGSIFAEKQQGSSIYGVWLKYPIINEVMVAYALLPDGTMEKVGTEKIMCPENTILLLCENFKALPGEMQEKQKEWIDKIAATSKNQRDIRREIVEAKEHGSFALIQLSPIAIENPDTVEYDYGDFSLDKLSNIHRDGRDVTFLMKQYLFWKICTRMPSKIRQHFPVQDKFWEITEQQLVAKKNIFEIALAESKKLESNMQIRSILAQLFLEISAIIEKISK